MTTKQVRWCERGIASGRPRCVLFLAMLMLPSLHVWAEEADRAKGARPVPEEAVIRFRLLRARDEAIRQQNERVLAPLISASRKLAANWRAVTDPEKLKLVEACENRLGLPALAGLPNGVLESNIPFAVPKTESLDIPFAKIDGTDRKRTSLDLYSPISSEKHPVVAWFHGGGMSGGDKSHPVLAVVKADYFVSKGFVFVSANYRLAPFDKFPAQAYDAAAAVSFLHDNVERHGGNPRQIFLIGDSAGGQLVSIISTNEKYLKHYGKSPELIAGVVVLDIGSFDIPSILDRLGESAPRMYRDFLGGDREAWIQASPLFHVEAGKTIPPMLLIYVEGREHHRLENHRFAAQMEKAGHAARVFEAKDRTHHTLALGIGTMGDPATEEVMGFFGEQTR